MRVKIFKSLITKQWVTDYKEHTCWQVSQRYGFSPLCVLLCLSMWYFWMNRMLHWSQLKGFSPGSQLRQHQHNSSLKSCITTALPCAGTHRCGSSRVAGGGTSEWSSCYIDCTGKASHLYDQEYNRTPATCEPTVLPSELTCRFWLNAQAQRCGFKPNTFLNYMYS